MGWNKDLKGSIQALLTNCKSLTVDAFTSKPFQGNPAAVCILPTPQSEDWMQKLAQEINLSETAFIVRQEDGFNLRWFTPIIEVPLCGHATLASAHVLWSEGYIAPNEPIHFHTKSGVLIAQKQGEWIELDFPVNHSQVISAPQELGEVLGVPMKCVMKNSLAYLVEVESEDVVREIQPNFELLKSLPIANVIVTSSTHKGSEYDFISRFFAPGVGINEDPVTGAAHCCLAPFWRERQKKDQFLAYQASKRGGVLKVRYDGGSRVYLGGQAVSIIRGELSHSLFGDG
ncbi:PhzF family phenazine biosynthesis protein [Aetokthonos hydrillicola Thurmond2011]|uniref:PhzF family phenazine biosynthesis protein n=1 Tax=Aetokthonos hydrillicola Thurmond2011 TaxID=2712845 RepID=A0AAP5IEE9_9CYAN|nr:PhzF family phenazine biosynthesis protein [Aetokthonos hydrillicola]MBO3463874.1 PhzF family phenazine biosynthesis protein [Aetokthonos hydrillicola CCALA 1050]MBW4584249.1 PhzF family phenazine biosynthesis protein [Aetokthonos hydrillicola CCALA 1050]MDR9898542.1 PhzF family phenazine biosynthesis protein [Aetokthonos hydrillicola Thurmond2011]